MKVGGRMKREGWRREKERGERKGVGEGKENLTHSSFASLRAQSK